jgi:hypothetical protein
MAVNAFMPMLEERLAGQLSMEFPRATLRQIAAEQGKQPAVYVGSALVTLDDDGRLILQFLTPTVLQLQEALAAANVPPGEPWPRSFVYEFEGVATDGRKWKCAEFFPNFSSGPGGTRSKSELDHLQGDFKAPTPEATVTAFYNRKADFFLLPWDSWPKDTIKHPLYLAMKTGLPVNGTNWKLALTGRNDWFSSHLSYAGSLPTHFGDKVVRALEYWLGVHLEPIYEDLCNAGKRTITLFSERLRPTRTAYPPVDHGHPDSARDSAALLALFLNRIATDASPDWPPIVIHARTATAAMDSPLDSMALLLGVSVEGLLRSEFADIKRVAAPEMVKDVAAAVKHIEQSTDYCADFKQRAPGSIRSLTGSGPRDKLIVLEGTGSLPVGSEKAWAKLRNKAAHPTGGSTVSLTEIHELYRASLSVLVLLHRLVFLLLGYKGSYTDYSSSGWQSLPWSSSKPSSPDAAVPPQGKGN